MFESYPTPKQEKINIDLAYEKALKILNQYRIKMSDFVGHYREEDIQRDIDYVKKRESQFGEKEINKEGIILEAIILEQIELSDYFGSNAISIPTSRYDDIANGVDGLVEFNQDNHFAYLGFSLDVTFSSSLYDKFEKIKEGLDTQKLTSVKYFKSENNQDIIGAMRKIPKFIVGADLSQTKDLINYWIKPNSKEKNDWFANNDVQFNILEQIILQAKSFKKYAQQGYRLEVVDKMDRVLSIMEKIYKERKKKLGRESVDREHSVYKNMVKILDSKFSGAVE